MTCVVAHTRLGSVPDAATTTFWADLDGVIKRIPMQREVLVFSDAKGCVGDLTDSNGREFREMLRSAQLRAFSMFFAEHHPVSILLEEPVVQQHET